jgi:hypothetical protein
MAQNSKFDGEDRRQKEEIGWHLDKKVPISIILTMLGLALTGFWGFADLKRDVELLKATTLVLHDRDTKQELDIHEALAQIREQYRDLSIKLDRLVERGQK